MRELVPPATITSASPRSMMLAASATANKLETSAVASELLGPRASCVIAMWQAGMFGKYFNIHKGYNSPWHVVPTAGNRSGRHSGNCR